MGEIEAKSLLVVSLWVKDLLRSAHFYRDVLGLELLPHHLSQPALRVGDTHLVLIQSEGNMPKIPAEPRWPILAFRVPDLDDAIEKLRENDIALAWGVESTAFARYVMFHDPDGYLLEVAELRE